MADYPKTGGSASRIGSPTTKGQLQIYYRPYGTPLDSATSVASYSFPCNPSKVSHSHTANYDYRMGPRGPKTAAYWLGTSPSEISFEVFLWGREQNDPTSCTWCEAHIAFWRMLVAPGIIAVGTDATSAATEFENVMSGSTDIMTMDQPPICYLTMGSLSEWVRFDSVDVKETMFNKNYKPVRAKVAVGGTIVQPSAGSLVNHTYADTLSAG